MSERRGRSLGDLIEAAFTAGWDAHVDEEPFINALSRFRNSFLPDDESLIAVGDVPVAIRIDDSSCRQWGYHRLGTRHTFDACPVETT